MPRSRQEILVQPYKEREDWSHFSESMLQHIADMMNLFFHEHEGPSAFANAFFRLFPTEYSSAYVPFTSDADIRHTQYARIALVGVIEQTFPEYAKDSMAILEYLGRLHVRHLISPIEAMYLE